MGGGYVVVRSVGVDQKPTFLYGRYTKAMTKALYKEAKNFEKHGNIRYVKPLKHPNGTFEVELSPQFVLTLVESFGYNVVHNNMIMSQQYNLIYWLLINENDPSPPDFKSDPPLDCKNILGEMEGVKLFNIPPPNVISQHEARKSKTVSFEEKQESASPELTKLRKRKLEEHKRKKKKLNIGRLRKRFYPDEPVIHKKSPKLVVRKVKHKKVKHATDHSHGSMKSVSSMENMRQDIIEGFTNALKSATDKTEKKKLKRTLSSISASKKQNFLRLSKSRRSVTRLTSAKKSVSKISTAKISTAKLSLSQSGSPSRKKK